MQPVLEIKQLTKTYPPDKKAVEKLSLAVMPGEIHGFIGHNGAGKTTTIRAVVGVMDFDGGEIWIAGHSVRQEPVVCKRLTAYIPDNPDLYDYITGMQYLNYMADLFLVGQARRQEQIHKYAALFGIADRLGSLVGDYSHGMKQKLALTGALLHDPKLLVLDEPFVGLDPEAAYHLKEVMRALCKQGGAIFFSTHVLDVAEKLCDQVSILKQGRLVRSGSMAQVRGAGSLEEVFMEAVENEN